MKKAPIYLLFFMVVSKLAFAQTGTDLYLQPFYNNLEQNSQNKKYNTAFYNDIEGSPYIYKSFTLSEIKGIKSKMLMRYNAFEDVLEIEKSPNEVYNLILDPAYETITMNYGNYKLRLLNYPNDDAPIKYGYLVEIASNDGITLLRRDKIIFKEGRLPKTSFELASPSKFTLAKSKYFIELKDKSIIEMPSSKKQLLEISPNKKQEIETFFKNKNYSFKEEQDLIEITKFLTTF